MKKVFCLVMLLFPLVGKSQTINQYKASNGITYHIDDTVRLGRGSNTNGSFLYLEDKGLIPSPAGRGSSRNLPKEFANAAVIVKSIRKMSVNGIDKYLFMVNPGGLFRYSVFIDDAILACEVVPCSQSATKPVTSVADEIKKLKELLDSGAISKAEYDAQKKKLLNQ